MRRFGQAIGIKPEYLEEYTRLHANVWPEVLKTIEECNIKNYSIFVLNDNLLFAYFEYVGDDFEADMAKMAADPKTQEWWSICGPMQEPLPNRKKGEWWMTLKEIFHHD
ncbi:MAG: L-rhamnose mutarotase [Chloroflexi bacterium]|nr:MAG: L-rhamnose mutarotase [Chloroflexota bacterium]